MPSGEFRENREQVFSRVFAVVYREFAYGVAERSIFGIGSDGPPAVVFSDYPASLSVFTKVPYKFTDHIVLCYGFSFMLGILTQNDMEPVTQQAGLYPLNIL